MNARMLVRKDNLRVAMFVTRSIEVVDLQIFSPFLLIDAEEEVLLRDNFFILARSKLLSSKFVPEVEFLDLLCDNRVNFLFYLLEMA